MKNLFLILCFILLWFHSQAQKIWTLEECIRHAVENNLEIKQAAITAEISKTIKDQSFLSLFPTLNGYGSHSYNYGRSLDPFSYEFTTARVRTNNFSLNSELVLFNGFQLQNALKQSRLEYISETYNLEKIKNDISLNVIAAYLQILYSQEESKAASDRIEAAAKQKEKAESLFGAGNIPKGSVLDAEAQLASEEYSKVTAQNLLTTSYLTLAQLLELPSVDSFKVVDPKVDIPAGESAMLTPDEIFKIAVNEKPEIKSAEYKVLSAERNLALAKGENYPRLALFGSLSSGYSNQRQRISQIIDKGLIPTGFQTGTGELIYGPSLNYIYQPTPFGNQVQDNFNKAFGISLTVPIFNGRAAHASASRAQLNLESARHTSQQSRNILYKSVQQAYTDAIAAMNKHKAADKSSAALKESFNYTGQKFDAGLITSIDFITSRNNLTKSESDLLQAKYDFIFRLKILDFYQGKPLTY